MKKEKELDERRKNEKLILSPDHPVRKLLLRMRERHCSRIFPTTLIVDIEQVSMARNRNINFFFFESLFFWFFRNMAPNCREKFWQKISVQSSSTIK